MPKERILANPKLVVALKLRSGYLKQQKNRYDEALDLPAELAAEFAAVARAAAVKASALKRVRATANANRSSSVRKPRRRGATGQSSAAASLTFGTPVRDYYSHSSSSSHATTDSSAKVSGSSPLTSLTPSSGSRPSRSHKFKPLLTSTPLDSKAGTKGASSISLRSSTRSTPAKTSPLFNSLRRLADNTRLYSSDISPYNIAHGASPISAGSAEEEDESMDDESPCKHSNSKKRPRNIIVISDSEESVNNIDDIITKRSKISHIIPHIRSPSLDFARAIFAAHLTESPGRIIQTIYPVLDLTTHGHLDAVSSKVPFSAVEVFFFGIVSLIYLILIQIVGVTIVPRIVKSTPKASGYSLDFHIST